MKLSKKDKKAIKNYLKIASKLPCKKAMCERGIAHILDRAKNPGKYSDSW